MPRGAPLTHVSKRVPDELLVGFNQSFCIPFSHDSRESSQVTIPRFQLVNRSRRSKSQFPNLRQSSIMKSKRDLEPGIRSRYPPRFGPESPSILAFSSLIGALFLD